MRSYRRPTAHWQNGASIGNGDLGGAVFGGGRETAGLVGVTMNKIDVWDERYDRRGHRYHHLDELRGLAAEHAATEDGRAFLKQIEPYGVVGLPNLDYQTSWYEATYPYPYAPPTTKPVGMVQIDPGADCEDFAARLSLHRASVDVVLEAAQQQARLVTFVDANSNTLVARVVRQGMFARPIAFHLVRTVDEQLGLPEVEAEGDHFWLRYSFPDGFSYVVWGVVVGGVVVRAETSEGLWTDIEARNGWLPEGGMHNREVQIEANERRAA